MSKFLIWLNRAEWLLRGISKAGYVLSALSILALVVVVGIGVLFRYVINAPLQFVDDLCALLYVALTFLAMAYVFVDRGHIRITFLFDRLPERAKHCLEIAGCLAALIFIILLIKETWIFFYTTYQLHGTSETASIPLAPWLFLIPLTLAIFIALILVFTIKKIVILVGKNETKERQT